MLKTDSIKPNDMKEKVSRDCVRKTRKILETVLSRRNLIKYLDRFYCELDRNIQKTRKMMTMQNALHRRNDADK